MDKVYQWFRWEHVFVSEFEYYNPYSDIILSVEYTGPDESVMEAYGFWDGDNTFKIRFMFPKPGVWTWRTFCSNPADKSLHNISGSITVEAYSGENPLYANGYIKPSSNGRYFTYNNEEPFLWVGDTAWVGPLKASFDEWKQYIDDRAAKNFSVIQISPASDWGGSADVNGNKPFTGYSLSKWKPDFWRSFEEKVQYANEKGIIVFIVGLMEPTFRYPDAIRAQCFARNLTSRLMGNFVAFSPSFDSPFTSLANLVGHSVRNASSMHLITQHCNIDMDVVEKYQDESYMDFRSIQTGWDWTTKSLEVTYRRVREWCTSLYKHQPFKPIVNVEAYYVTEGHLKYQVLSDNATPYDNRVTAYTSFLCGAAGYTYGANGIWQWIKGSNVLHNWDEAIKYISSEEMNYLYQFFSGIRWWELEPASHLINNQEKEGQKMMVLAKNISGTLAVAYLPGNQYILIDMDAFTADMKGKWFNPEKNIYIDINQTIPRAGLAGFYTPSGGDWALLLEGL